MKSASPDPARRTASSPVGVHLCASVDQIPKRLRAVYRALAATYRYEDWHWSPAHIRGPFDTPAGAVLVQHTTWINAERALDNLRAAGTLHSRTLASMPEERIAELVRVSGTPAIKARRLRALATMVEDAGGIDALFALPTDDLRARLLATHGIGPETADAIMLYAAGRRVFEVDAYAQRLFGRLGFATPPGTNYAAWQHWFEDALADEDAAYFQRYHAYIVLHCKALCRATPICAPCPLLSQCPEGQRRIDAHSPASPPRASQ